MVLLVVGGALSYQLLHQRAEIVEKPVPGLGKQQLKSGDEGVTADLTPIEHSRQSVADAYIKSL